MAVHASPHDASPACPACGAPSLHGASFCSRCGHSLSEPGPRRGRLAYEACTVERWRGYVTSRFYAATDDGAVIFESKPFRWRRADSPPDEGAAREAYDELVRALERQGWRRSSVGDLWWESRFTRGVSPPAQERTVIYPEPIALPERLLVDEAATLPLPLPEPVSEPARVAPRADEPAPVPAEEPSRPRRISWKRRRVFFAAAWLLTVPAAAFLLLTTVPRGNAEPSTGSVAHMVVPERPTVAAPKAAPAPLAATRVPRLVVTGSDRSTWLEIRRGSAAGAVLYSGQLAAGRRIAFSGARLWGRFGAAGNITISFDGRRVPLQGTVDHLFAATR